MVVLAIVVAGLVWIVAIQILRRGRAHSVDPDQSGCLSPVVSDDRHAHGTTQADADRPERVDGYHFHIFI
jgi:hypothetical protein